MDWTHVRDGPAPSPERITGCGRGNRASPRRGGGGSRNPAVRARMGARRQMTPRATAPAEPRRNSDTLIAALKLLRRRFIGFFSRDVVDELPWFHAEPPRNFQERQHTGTALPVLNVDKSSKAQPAALRELFQAVAPSLPESTDLHTKG